MWSGRMLHRVASIAYCLYIIITGKNDLTRCVTHREAVSGPVIHSIFDAWHYDVLWTCELTRLLWYASDYGRLILYIMLHSIKLSNALHCTIPSKLWCTILITLPACLTYAPKWDLKTLPSTLWVRSQVHSQACSQGRSSLHSMEYS